MSKKNRNSNSFEIALSGIACAVAVLFLDLGVVFSGGWLIGTGYFVGVIALMIPLSKKFYVADFLTYIATCVLTLIMGAVVRLWDMVPFVIFFGLHPLINALIARGKINQYFFMPLKALWFDGMLVVAYHLVYGAMFGGSLFPQEFYDTINNYIYLIIFTAGTVIGLIYDFLVIRCQRAVDLLISRIRK